jgi:hypothetical protein
MTCERKFARWTKGRASDAPGDRPGASSPDIPLTPVSSGANASEANELRQLHCFTADPARGPGRRWLDVGPGDRIFDGQGGIHERTLDIRIRRRVEADDGRWQKRLGNLFIAVRRPAAAGTVCGPNAVSMSEVPGRPLARARLPCRWRVGAPVRAR